METHAEGKIRVKTFRDLIVWQKGYAMALESYRLSRAFPKDELFGLTSQLRRASVSVPANIAEGSVKGTREFVQALKIAQGSLEESKCYYLLAKDLGYIKESDFDRCTRLADDVGRLLRALLSALIKKIQR